MKKKKPYYEEQYKTCIFFARFLYYATFAGTDDPKYEEWFNFVVKVDEKAPGFIGSGSVKKPFLGRILIKILPVSSKILKLPFVGSYFSTSPRKAYQIWCAEFEKLGLTYEEIVRIIDANINGPCGPEWDCFGDRAWWLIQSEKEYVPFISEIKYIYNVIKSKKF